VQAVTNNGLVGCTAQDGTRSAFDDGGGRYIRTIPNRMLNADAIAQALDDDGVNTVGVVAPTDDPDYEARLLDGLDQRGIAVDPLIEYDRDAVDPVDIITRLNDSGNHGAVLLGSADLADVVVTGVGPGYLGPFYGDETLDTDAVGNKVAGSVQEGGSVLNVVSPEPLPDIDGIDVVQRMTDNLGHVFPFAAPYVYDCVVLAAVAVQAAGGVDTAEAIAGNWTEASTGGDVCITTDCLALAADGEDIDYSGASGPLDLDDNGQVEHGVFDYWRFNAASERDLIGTLSV
jgi:branched-chain amino acid transport system substrate-binding protein